MNKGIIAIDFNDTICDDKHVPTGHRLGPPTHGAKEALDYFIRMGYYVVIHCVWADSDKNIATIAKWMDYFDLPYNEITNKKPAALAYIDDRALRYENNWIEIMNKF